MIIDDLRTLLLDVRKSKDSWFVTFYSTLIGEVEAIGKNKGNRQTTDEEAQKLMKSWIFNNEKSLEYLSPENTSRKDLLLENMLLRKFLPVELSDAELRTIIQALITKLGKNQGAVMKELKLLHSNQYDGKVAASIVKEFLLP